MRRPAWWLGLAGLALALTGCLGAGSGPTPISIVIQPLDTATGFVPPSETPSARPSHTATATAPSATPTDSELRTKTPGPTATETPTRPTPTRTRVFVPGPTRTPVPPTATPGGASAPIGPAPDTSAQGVSATFRLESRTRIFNPEQKIWFRFTLSNLRDTRLEFGFVGVALSNGGFHTSWSGHALEPGATLSWRDWASFAQPGDYGLTLAMCFSSVDTCLTGGTWANLSAQWGVTIR